MGCSVSEEGEEGLERWVDQFQRDGWLDFREMGCSVSERWVAKF